MKNWNCVALTVTFSGIWFCTEHSVSRTKFMFVFFRKNENLMLKAWHRWKLAHAKVQAANKVTAYNDRKVMTQV